MEENFESNPLYKDVENYLSQKDSLNLKREQEKRAQRIKLIIGVLSIALPILLSLAVLVTIIFNPLKLSLPDFLKNFLKPNLLRPVISNPEVSKRRLPGRILGIKQIPSGLWLTTDIKDATDITIIQNTTLSFLSKDVSQGGTQRTAATLQDLKIGQKIIITLVYTLKIETWSIIRVDILI